MNKIEDIKQKRALLLTTRLRFSPQIQPIKQTAIDKIVEQILLVDNDGKGLSIKKIQSILHSESGGYIINIHEIKNCINGLINKERVEIKIQRQQHLYKLTDKAKPDIKEIQQEAIRRFKVVIDRLFKNAKGGSSIYMAPFLECLSHIFSRLGEEYVRVIKGEVSKEDFLTIPFISSVFEKIVKSYDSIEASLFKNAIDSFFREIDPEYDAIKWNMAQNYFLVKALGLDPDILSLFKETFENATFYFDTNLIIPALEPRNEYHESFKALHKACERLNIKFKVCQISLDELRGWLGIQREQIEKVKDQIPKDMAEKVYSDFYQAYEEKRCAGEIFDIDEIFRNFDSPREYLEEYFQIELEDDLWFDKAKYDPETIRFAETLQDKSLDIRKRSKTWYASIHDALLLLWIHKLRKQFDGNIWLITADTSLPGSLPQHSNARLRSLAITQDALLQWISPIWVQEEDEKDFVAIFAEIIKHRLLPQERIFDLEDFIVFHDLNLSCRNLPSKDVEGCIRYIKENAPMLNPLEPVDREKIAYEVAKYFSSPGRIYKQDQERLEADNLRIKNELESIRKQHKIELEESDKRAGKLEKEFSMFKKKIKDDSLKRSAKSRIGVLLFALVVLEAIVIFFVRQYGEGANSFQKIINSWPILAAIVVGISILGYFWLGKERFKVLSWPIKKALKLK